MIKEAITEHPVSDFIRNRWSPRSFAARSIKQEDLETLLEAASWAFSANNAQPWRYIYAHKGTEAFNRMVECLLPGNQPWAKNAAVLMVSLVERKMENGAENKWAKHDLGAANATLMLQALDMHIYGHVMAGFNPDKTIETLNLNPENQEPVAFLALGYLDVPEKLEEPFKTREVSPRTRKKPVEFSRNLDEVFNK